MLRLALFIGAEVAFTVGVIAFARHWREILYRIVYGHPLDDGRHR